MNERTRALAEALTAARSCGETLIAADWSEALPDAASAYLVQAAVGEALGWRERDARHWKSGGPSREAELTHAPLPPEGVLASPADYSGWTFHTPTIEAEVALRLGQDVSPDEAARLSPQQAEALVEAICVSIEIVDSRWLESAQAPPLQRLADLQSHGALVLGAWQTWRRRDWSRQRCTVRIGDAVCERIGTHPLGDPAWLLTSWLRHATRNGDSIAAGTVVTTGSWVGMLPVQRGELVDVRFDGLGEARTRL